MNSPTFLKCYFFFWQTEMGWKINQPPSALREILIKQRRRFLHYIRRQRERRLHNLAAPSVVENEGEVLDLSLKHEAPLQSPLPQPPPVPPLPQQFPDMLGPLAMLCQAPFAFPAASAMFQFMMLRSAAVPTPFSSYPAVPTLPSPPPPSAVPTLTPPCQQTANPRPVVWNRKKNSYKDAPKLITCPVAGCNQKFPWNSSLKRHILTHTPHKPFSCTRCTKAFSTKSNRERHMERVHRVSLKRQKRDPYGSACCSAAEEFLREEEIASMQGNDRQADDISNTLLRSAGSPLVEPNPERCAQFTNTNTTTTAATIDCMLTSAASSASIFSKDRSPAVCSLCGKQFALQYSLRRHLKTHMPAF
uniref:C2H2-type domain-containing protein n=1 Tax=Mesocestoides corti TaxID=53468 RepID=A0A5K3FN19_MESCO